MEWQHYFPIRNHKSTTNAHGPPQMEHPAMNGYSANHHGPDYAQAPACGWDQYHPGMQTQYDPSRNGMNAPAQYSPAQYPATNDAWTGGNSSNSWSGAGGYQTQVAMPPQNMPSFEHQSQYDHQTPQQNFVPQPLHNSSRHGSWNENGNGYSNGYANGYGGSSIAPTDRDMKPNEYGRGQQDGHPGGYPDNQHTVHFAHQPMKPSKRGQRHTGKQVSPKSVRSEAAQGR